MGTQTALPREVMRPSAGDASNAQTTSLARGVEGRWGADAQVCSYVDGSVYVGQISGGRRHGEGMWRGHVSHYEGQWVDDKQHGKGRQVWSDGRIYDGEFKYQKFSGRGRMVWNTANGMHTYEGQYKDDLKHGLGKFVWADGRSYDGEWVKGQRHGTGVYINSKGEQKLGCWIHNKLKRCDTDRTRFKALAVPMLWHHRATVQLFAVASVLGFVGHYAAGAPSTNLATLQGGDVSVAQGLPTSKNIEGIAPSGGGTCNATAINVSGPVLGSTCTWGMLEGSTCVVVCASGYRAEGFYTCYQAGLSGLSYCQHDNLRGRSWVDASTSVFSKSLVAFCLVIIARIAAIGIPLTACCINRRRSGTNPVLEADLPRLMRSVHVADSDHVYKVL